MRYTITTSTINIKIFPIEKSSPRLWSTKKFITMGGALFALIKDIPIHKSKGITMAPIIFPFFNLKFIT